MYKFLSVMLVAFAISTPARADVFGIYSSNGGPEQVVNGQVHAPTQNGFVDGSMHGYPFYSGCCESKSCADHLWDGFCSGKSCKAPRIRHHGGVKGGCGCDACGGMGYGHGSCGKGGCGHAAPYGFGGKSSFGGYMSYRGMSRKGSCGIGAPCGSKGCDTCDPSAPKHHCRLGLFDWLHFGHGHGCNVCGGGGCSACGAVKGGYGKGGYLEYDAMQGAPVPAPMHGHDNNYYGTPSEIQGNPSLQPPEVLVEPTSTSDRSAWRRQVPANPFARPLSY